MKIVSLIFAFIIANSVIAANATSPTTMIRCESSDHENILVLVADIAKQTLLFGLQQEQYFESGSIQTRISIQNNEQLLTMFANATPKCPAPSSSKFCLDRWDPPVKYVKLENLRESDDVYFEYQSTKDHQDVQARFKGLCTVITQVDSQ